ncbi:hypothetical protein TNCT_404321 [Trichonephila clavata]|uniref:Uncharacterized protein n=1 Tax=Trichonephila clavata TaxID=2740835 RepID=A0A8X6HDK0_TRICU|nr:hypothetical protein TNCT_404321 [Trichonephila clavata]
MLCIKETWRVLDCWKRNPRWRERGKQYFSLYRSKVYGCPTEVSRTACRWKVLLVKVLKIFMDSFKPLFCCVDGCISAQRRYPAVHGQVGGMYC